MLKIINFYLQKGVKYSKDEKGDFYRKKLRIDKLKLSHRTKIETNLFNSIKKERQLLISNFIHL